MRGRGWWPAGVPLGRLGKERKKKEEERKKKGRRNGKFGQNSLEF
jgi:hypothetical protein